MTVDFLWDEPARPTRGPKPSMSLARIADAGIAIADAEGLAALSMQRVAADLGFTKMSLYRYLPGKAELVSLMVERALGEPPSANGTDWRDALAGWARLLMDGYVRHPWCLPATVGSRPVGPREVAWLESALTALAGTPLTRAERMDAIVVLVGHARMLAEQAASQHSEAQLNAAFGRVVSEHRERYPELAAALLESSPDNREQAFEFGLARILDGIEALIQARAERS
jgi:AcrR family transcriptional regulator